MDKEETYEEEDIPFNFGDSYNQDKLFEGYVDDDSYAEPYRYLTRWYLTSTLSNIPHRRYALPKNGRFSSDHVLYGYLIPSDGERPRVRVKIVLHGKTWVVDRSITLRGIWVTSGKAWYWLQEPCNRKLEVRLRVPPVNQEEPLVALVPSQVDVHLEIRALLGLLSNLCDILLHSDLAENVGLQADVTPGRYLKHHIQKKPAELWEALRCRNNEMWDQYGNDKDGIITPYEPFDLGLMEAHASFVKTHMLNYNAELSERCTFIKGLGLLAKQRGRNKASSWSESGLIASARLAEHRSQREAWGAPLEEGQQFRPNWVLEAQVQMAAEKAAAKKAVKSDVKLRPALKRKRASENEDFIRKQLKRTSLRKKEMPVAVFRTLESDEDHQGLSSRVGSTDLEDTLYDTDEEQSEAMRIVSSIPIKKNKISRKNAKRVAVEGASLATSKEDHPDDGWPPTPLSAYCVHRMRQAFQLLREFTVKYDGGHDWESLSKSSGLQYVDLEAAGGAYDKMLRLQTPTPEAKLLFALLFRNACLAKQNKIAKKPFQLKSNPAKLLFEDWRTDAIKRMETLPPSEGETDELYLVTIMRCIEVCDVVKEFKQLDGLKHKKEIDWEKGISETLKLASSVQSEMLVQACSAANSRVKNILSRVAAKKEATARREAEEQAAKEEKRRLEEEKLRLEEERRKTREVERKLAIEAVRRHSEKVARKKKEDANARKQKEHTRHRPLKMKDLVARHSKASPVASMSSRLQTLTQSNESLTQRKTESYEKGVTPRTSVVQEGSEAHRRDGHTDETSVGNDSTRKKLNPDREWVYAAVDPPQNGPGEPATSVVQVTRRPEALYSRPSGFGRSGVYDEPTEGSETSQDRFKRTSYSQLADRREDSRVGDPRVVVESSLRIDHGQMGGPCEPNDDRDGRYRFLGSDGSVFSRMDVMKKESDRFKARTSSPENDTDSALAFSYDRNKEHCSGPQQNDSDSPHYESRSHRYSDMDQDRYAHELTQRNFDGDDGRPIPRELLAPYIEIANEPHRRNERSKRYAAIDSESRGAHDESFSQYSSYSISSRRSRSRSRSGSTERPARDKYRVDAFSGKGASTSNPRYSSGIHRGDSRLEIFSSVYRDDERREVARAVAYGELGTRPRREESKSRSASRYSSLADDDYHERLRQKNEEQLREVTRKRELDKFMAERSSYQKRLHIQSALDEGKLPYEGAAPPQRETIDQSDRPQDGSDESALARTTLTSTTGKEMNPGDRSLSKQATSGSTSRSNRAARPKPPKKRDNDSGERDKRSSTAVQQAGLNALGTPEAGVSRGRGRGRGVSNLPAWMTRQGLTSLSQPPLETASAPQMENGALVVKNKTSLEPPVIEEDSTSFPNFLSANERTNPRQTALQNSSAGRGRGRVLPAWMTRGDQALVSVHPAQSTNSVVNGIPECGFAVESHSSAQMQHNSQPNSKSMASGYGRGINLPAWMTRGENLLGKAPSYPSEQSAHHSTSAATEKARSRMEPAVSNTTSSTHSSSERRRSTESQTRQSKPPAFPTARSGRGRGRGVSNLPAWMTRAGNNVP